MKSLLEKVYFRVFDVSKIKGKNPELSEEGQQLIQISGINPSEIIQKTLEDFTKQIRTNNTTDQKQIAPVSPSLFNGTSLGSPLKTYTSFGFNKKNSDILSNSTEKDISVLQTNEIAKIRYDHYQKKRYQHLSKLNQIIEMLQK